MSADRGGSDGGGDGEVTGRGGRSAHFPFNTSKKDRFSDELKTMFELNGMKTRFFFLVNTCQLVVVYIQKKIKYCSHDVIYSILITFQSLKIFINVLKEVFYVH